MLSIAILPKINNAEPMKQINTKGKHKYKFVIYFKQIKKVS